MRVFIEKYYQYRNRSDHVDTVPLLPPVLSLTPTVIDSGLSCEGNLQITNIGKTSIAISQLGIRITTIAPSKEKKHYNIIDACAFTICGAGKAGGDGCGGYLADLFVDAPPLQVNSAFFTDLRLPNLDEQVVQKCGGLVIAPGQSSEIELCVVVANLTANYSYTFTPEIVVNTSNSQQHILLSPLSYTDLSTQLDTFTCYALNNKSVFTAETPNLDEKPSDVTYLGGYGNGPQCI